MLYIYWFECTGREEKNQSVYHEIRLRCFAVTLNRLFMLINSSFSAFLSSLHFSPFASELFRNLGDQLVDFRKRNVSPFLSDIEF